ncbi:uncharacterized protein H6S33_005138 [Morchella sextelata]|uniref:uncharacterized protein n=1 Tax=Morchella sextelata TaxID=1174677 RepID=UPI001D03D72E|nr:uncharacterized protein H6S33_005138 [Morchella sextelata]KAH0605156.1 hypothetical protein H6S33_005138 [Morchella sextelata]
MPTATRKTNSSIREVATTAPLSRWRPDSGWDSDDLGADLESETNVSERDW